MRKGIHLGVAARGRGTTNTESDLLRVVDRDFAEAARKAGSWLKCESGCSSCCHGPFPITRLDALRLERGLAAARSTDPERAEAIERRARAAVARMGQLQLADQGGLDDRFAELAALACPALDPESGRCELYEWRPVACRTYGPPIRFGDEKGEPCELCFDGADPATIERCRYEPDRDGIESALLRDLGVDPGEEWESLVAVALVVG